MDFLNAMQQRYTTKKYNSTQEIAPEKIEALKEILRLTPSSINSQPWKFTFVSDKKTKEKLSEVSWINTQKVLDCDTLIVLSRVNDLLFFEKRIKEELPKGAVDYYHNKVKPLTNSEIKAWFDKQVYIALGILLSACATMGIDSTPMEGIEPDSYDNILSQDMYHTLVAVAIGHRSEDDQNQPSIKPKSRIALSQIVENV